MSEEIKKLTAPAPTIEAAPRVEELPPRYKAAAHTLLKEAEKLDVGFRHRWVLKTKSGINEQMKRWGGWEPLEDKERIKRIGLGGLVSATGRATWLDTELWAMPVGRADLIRAEHTRQLDEQMHTKREETAAEFADIQGRTAAKVRPFIKTDKRETVTV